MQTIKARITYTRTVRETRELPIAAASALAGLRSEAYDVLAALLARGIDTDGEVAIHARDLPPGCSARKPTGETTYTRVRSEAWLYKTLGVPDETRVLVTSGDGGVGLWEPDTVVVVKLSDIADDWFLGELSEMHCPK